MKEQLINYGFVLNGRGWLEFKKNEWLFHYSPVDNYMWIFAPDSNTSEEGICLRELTYERIIKLIEFISEY